MNDEIRLILPAKEQMLLVARMTLAGYACQFGADMDTMDDIRTLSDEACYCLMHQPQPADTLSISAGMEGPLMKVRFEAKRQRQVITTEVPHDPEIAHGILSSLASDVQLSHNKGDMHAIEVAVHLGPL